MYCPSCGTALAQMTKYCNRCGAKLNSKKSDPVEKRLDDYLDGLFWITVFGLGLILGGMALMKKVLQLGDGLIIAYLVLSSTAFTINFALSLWQIFRMTRNPKGLKGDNQTLDTNDLGPAREPLSLDAPPSVTERTTRDLEHASKEPVTNRSGIT
ncbi:MAG TPA: zinc ribbon domain-containing protein [Blastocatellia bacterium]|nr:zinc ribbon domain-containing protein [Blastocatellia bacterium]